jgi:ketosteroid isomerase-like protein
VPLKYVVIWKRQGGGHWMMAVDIWNSLPPV